MNYYVSVLKKYAEFNGRAGRAEYWYFVLFNLIISIGINIIDSAFSHDFKTSLGLGMFGLIYSLVVFIPSLAVSVRRLHDTNRSGWMILVSLIPLIGAIWIIILMATKGDKEKNKYGASPKK